MSQNFDVNDFDGFSKLPDALRQSIKILFVFNDRNEKPPYNISGKNTIFVTDKDELNVFGNNTLGILGLKHRNVVKTPFHFRELSYKGFNNFFNGCHHVIAINDKQEVYSWGYNNYGQLGRGNIESASLGPVKNDFLSNKSIVDVSCGDWHTLALTAIGEVYAWGKNNCGQIGIAKTDKIIDKPIKLEFSRHKIIAISCGSTHSMALTQNGRVFSWGGNNFGQLGIGTIKNSNEPEIIEIQEMIPSIKEISCGQNHSILLSQDGYIHAFGESYLDGSQKMQKSPFKLESSEEFTDIASIISYPFSVALSNDNICYELGKIGSNLIRSPQRSNSKSFYDYFRTEWKITLRTINAKKKFVKPSVIIEENLLFEKNRLKNDVSQSTSIKGTSRFSNQNTAGNLLIQDLQRANIGNQTVNRQDESKQFENDDISYDNGKYTKDFKEITHIGEGGFGSVYKVYKKFECQFYAIKKIDLQGLSKEAKEFALNELKTMAKLQNEYVVQYKTAWLENTEKLFIQMELCLMTLKPVIDGKQTQFRGNSSEVIGPLECYFGCEIFKEIAECLEFLHKLNPPIMHRDLKPQNILISNGSNRRFIKLGDFGLAKFHTKEDESHTKGVGSMKYMAPEVLRDNKYDTSADIYSFGVITQELFDINTNSSRKWIFSKNSISEDIFKKFFDLICEMMHNLRMRRPSSEKLIEEISLIQPTYEEITNDSKFNELTDQFKNIKTIEENFYVFFLRLKFESFKKNK